MDIFETRHASSNINIGVSSCLLGHAVRYDGQHKYHHIIVKELGMRCNLIPFCPEIAIGMGVPRPPIQLVDINGDIRAIDKAHSTPDYTQQLRLQGNKYLTNNPPIHGYIFQEKSPSCGVESVKVHNEDGVITHTHGTGIFAAALLKALPGIPVIEAAQLTDKKAVNAFLKQAQRYGTSINSKSRGN
ncbi:MAG: DUF523 domain-containing protein [Thiotrichaceae bacterium]